MVTTAHPPVALRNNPKKVAIASMIGTAIEFYDYYIYAAAVVLVFGTQFFDKNNEQLATIASFSTLALAFIARPLGSALFGHFGDKYGRKKTLVASLLTMGISTVAIGLLPNYAQIGILAPLLLCVFRIGQGLGLGGEWGGAALVATENAPEGKRAWYGTFPQLGAPIGLFLANGVFFLVSAYFGKEALVEWAWRIPFLLSLLLVFIGLYVRLTLHESHVYKQAVEEGKKENAPVMAVMRDYWKIIIQGTFVMSNTYVIFYIMTAFVQFYSKSPVKMSDAGYATGLGIPANTFTGFLLIGAVVFGIFTSIAGLGADKFGRKKWMTLITIAIFIFSLFIPALLNQAGEQGVLAFLVIGMALMGLTFGPMAALLPELFPTEVRYSGASLSYNLASIIGASVPTLIAIDLNARYGLWGIGIYSALNAVVTLIALQTIKETKNISLTDEVPHS